MRLIVYVHQNPRRHMFVEDFRDWRHSSYQDLLGTNQTRLPRQKVMSLFGDRDDFVRLHERTGADVDLDVVET